MLIDSYPYLTFNGNAEEALNFYAAVLKADILDISKFKDMPPHPDNPVLSDEVQNMLMNATLQLTNGSYLMFSDNPFEGGQGYKQGNNVSVTLVYETAEETREVFDQLKVNGKIVMPLEETFWSPLYGNVIDQFGIEWQISTFVPGMMDKAE
ncbi:VOC family protein [Carnobacterium alterfunditum]|uniref:VOC family protein n=1 Tax=Carnobacterium alterfunditum TaxID=28230 RepID=UPI003593DCAA